MLFIDSLLQQPALVYLEGTDAKPSDVRPISNAKDLKLIEQRLHQIEQLILLFTNKLPFSIAGTQDETDEPPALSAIFLTASANRLLGNDFLPNPINVANLQQLKSLTIVVDTIASSFEQDLYALNEELAPECRFFIDFCLDIWEQFFSDFTEFSAETMQSIPLLLNHD